MAGVPAVGSATPSDAKHWVVSSLVVTGTLAVLDDVAHGHAPSARIALGLLVSGVILTVLADAAPPLAAGFAALLLVASVINLGGKAFADISKGVK